MRFVCKFILISFTTMWIMTISLAEYKTWSKQERAFLEPLTTLYHDWDPRDFGQDTTEEEQALLVKFKPDIYIGPAGIPPIDFYEYYLPKTTLKDPEGRPIVKAPSREVLKIHERKYGTYLDFKGDPSPCRGKKCKDYSGVLYGRVFYETMSPRSQKSFSVEVSTRDVIVLKYNAAFGVSGLPKKIGLLRGLGGMIGGDLENWHELDIHGAIQIILDKETKEPLILLLAQHNHFRTLINGVDFNFPDEGRLKICFAERSNEPYLCPTGKKAKKYPTVGDPSHGYFIFGVGRQPLQGGKDVVYGPDGKGVLVSTTLKFLPTMDPLYVSWIPLGDRQKIMGFVDSFSRSGPPGINMNTWPQTKKYSDIAQFWYFEEGDETLPQFFKDNFDGFFKVNFEAVFDYNGKRFFENLREGWASKYIDDLTAPASSRTTVP